jgi:outer membrane murein-binding lipoprotein Lpp
LEAVVTLLTSESEIIAQIERLEMDARDLRRRIEHARTEADKRVLNRQLLDMDDEIKRLRWRLG